MDIQPFQIDIPQLALDDLRTRLACTRWPDEVPDAGWDYGVSLAYMRELVAYWGRGFDWRREERAMNALLAAELREFFRPFRDARRP